MRVTEGMRYAQVTRGLAALTAEHAKASRQASSGRRLEQPSADPVAAAELSRLRASQSQTAAHRNVIRDARGDAELTEATLAQANSLFVRAHEIAMQGANGSLGADERAALAEEVHGLKQELVGLANTRGTRGYLFSGSQTDTAAFSNGGVFQGDDVDHVVQIGNAPPQSVSVSGAEAFTAAGGRDVFADLDALEAALAANDQSAASATLTGLESSRQQIVKAEARAGTIIDRLDTSDQVLEQLQFEFDKRQGEIDGVDPVDAYTRLVQLGQALEQAVSVSRQLLDVGRFGRF